MSDDLNSSEFRLESWKLQKQTAQTIKQFAGDLAPICLGKGQFLLDSMACSNTAHPHMTAQSSVAVDLLRNLGSMVDKKKEIHHHHGKDLGYRRGSDRPYQPAVFSCVLMCKWYDTGTSLLQSNVSLDSRYDSLFLRYAFTPRKARQTAKQQVLEVDHTFDHADSLDCQETHHARKAASPCTLFCIQGVQALPTLTRRKRARTHLDDFDLRLRAIPAISFLRLDLFYNLHRVSTHHLRRHHQLAISRQGQLKAYTTAQRVSTHLKSSRK